MYNLIRFLVLLVLLSAPAVAYSDSVQSTRVIDPNQHACTGGGGYPYREKYEYVLKELDLKKGDVVVDIGAGDGWWAEKMVKFVGSEGIIHASEIKQEQVDKMKEKFTDVPQIKPYLCPTDSTALKDNSCDMAFLSKTYHHLKGHIDYLSHLRKVIKPTGRLCIIEKHPSLGSGRGKGHTFSPGLLMQQADEAGWIPARYELITGTYHYIAIFVQRELFQPEQQQKKTRAG
ncbi:MAG: class I SAM-dependent methyltransferase [Phycisphaerae bacterium]|nr:class I SAM-dependent methyltransferase [Phycisphaerae bacterium]